jgi:hypothetical protein
LDGYAGHLTLYLRGRLIVVAAEVAAAFANTGEYTDQDIQEFIRSLVTTRAKLKRSSGEAGLGHGDWELAPLGENFPSHTLKTSGVSLLRDMHREPQTSGPNHRLAGEFSKTTNSRTSRRPHISRNISVRSKPGLRQGGGSDCVYTKSSERRHPSRTSSYTMQFDPRARALQPIIGV